MAFTHKITRSYRDSSSATIGSQETITADSEANWSGTGTHNATVEVDIALTRANLKSLCLLSDQDVEVNAEHATPLDVDDVTNASGGDIVVTTTADHGLAVGQKVRIVSVGGATNLNSTWYVVAVPTTVTFKVSTTLGGSATDGNDAAYTSGGSVYPQDRNGLVSGIAVVWSLATDGLAKCPYTADIGKFFIKNADADTDAAVQIRTLTDQTP